MRLNPVAVEFRLELALTPRPLPRRPLRNVPSSPRPSSRGLIALNQQLLLSEWIPAPPAAVRDDERRENRRFAEVSHRWGEAKRADCPGM